MCGIIAQILANKQGLVAPELFEGLGLLQHRGQVSQRVPTSTPTHPSL
jgi:glutamine phosphoribosylpyrophosphate amidotransferase